MNTHDIELPPPPTPDADHYDTGTFAPVWKKGKMEAYGKQCYQAGVEAYRQSKGEVVVTKTPDGEIVAVTRQDAEGRILSVIAEADRKRRGEIERLLAERDALREALTELCDEIDKHEIHAAISKTSISWFKRKARSALAQGQGK